MKLAVLLFIVTAPLLTKALMYRYLYHERINNAKDPSDYSDLHIPFNVKRLVEQFDPNIKIRISDGLLIETSAATYNSHPAYIVLSKRLFEKRGDDREQFSTDDITTVVAHELGHIIPKSNFNWSVWLGLSAILCFFTIGIAAASTFTLLGIAYFFCSFLITLFLIKWLAFISREEEYQADCFAIIQGKIPVENFIRCLVKMDYIYRKEKPPETRWAYSGNTFLKVLFKSHPAIEERILRARALYDTII